MKLITVIHPNSDVVKKVVVNVDYKMLSGLVGGLIETVPQFNKYYEKPCIAYCNEEAILKEMEFNEVATTLWDNLLKGKKLWYKPVILGPLVIVQTVK